MRGSTAPSREREGVYCIPSSSGERHLFPRVERQADEVITRHRFTSTGLLNKNCRCLFLSFSPAHSLSLPLSLSAPQLRLIMELVISKNHINLNRSRHEIREGRNPLYGLSRNFVIILIARVPARYPSTYNIRNFSGSLRYEPPRYDNLLGKSRRHRDRRHFVHTTSDISCRNCASCSACI